MPKCLLGVDVGTSGTKALVLGVRGNVVATATAEHPIHFPRPGWSEQDPGDWWKSTTQAVKAALRKAGVNGESVQGIGLSGQMHGSVFLDDAGEPLRHALLWNDQRTGAECADIERRAGGRKALIRMVNNVALTGYTAPKILWVRKREPATFKRVRTVLLPKDYINYRLTGVLAAEVSDASGTLLLDVRKRTWSEKLLKRLGLKRDLLPDVVESTEVIGTLTATAARALGLKAGTPVVGGAGDQAAAAVGTGVVRNGVVSATIGTSGVVFAYSDEPVANEAGLLQSFCHAVPGAWCVFGCMLSAGGSLQWAREVLYADALRAAKKDSERDALYTRMIDEASKAEGGDTLLFHPYLTGERCPYPHPHARGGWLGLTRRHERGHLVRAVVEGITLGMNRQIRIMKELGVSVREVRLAGGGARNAWWRQLQADIYGVRCVRMHSEEGSALGAAILAGMGTNTFRTFNAACAVAARIRSEHRPDRTVQRRYGKLTELAAETYETLEPLYREDF